MRCSCTSTSGWADRYCIDTNDAGLALAMEHRSKMSTATKATMTMKVGLGENGSVLTSSDLSAGL